ncbi:hypothetical protein TRICI_005766 [Trichomonascus ciferrii]|uniref:Copia protein n=1 Tax=Trichomonascus ciferrii TaxID=44093 RepID=A0A642URG9_9ASCO|nr:hypothetical protein TRICI_005766 [Trichomonascus ciferrii]
MKIYYGNSGSKSITENPIHHLRTKHTDIRHHFIREKAKKQIIEIVHIDTQEILADIFTKNLDLRPSGLASVEAISRDQSQGGVRASPLQT